MSDPSVLIPYLENLGEPQLAALLHRRPEVLTGVPPHDLSDLAERMWHRNSLIAALHSRSLPCLQLVEAIALLGDGFTAAELAQLLEGDGPNDHAEEQDVAAVIGELVEYGIIISDSAGRLLVPDAMSEIIPSPLGLGSPMRVIIEGLTVDAMRRIQVALGLERATNRAGTTASLLEFFRSQDAILQALATAPGDVLMYLVAMADDAEHDERSLYDSAGYRVRQKTLTWATARGMLVGPQYDPQLPAEVARALRGFGFRGRFTPRYPRPAVRPVDSTRVNADAAAAATRFADLVLAALDRVARVPLVSLKSGGVGVRELTKVAKSVGADGFDVRLALELADACELLEHGRGVGVSEKFASWRESDPGRRFAALLVAWWNLGRTATEDRDDQDKTVPAVSRRGHCDSCRAARVALVETINESGGAGDPVSFSRATLWRRPLVHVFASDPEGPFARTWREAETLGVISQGTCTDLGRALLAGDLDACWALTAQWLPPSADQAKLGADLTAFVMGAPSRRVSTLLDSAADRESHGSASSWRFSPASVRRAMDDGASADDLRAALAAIAGGDIPQPLEYLIADVARRHGQLRLASATSCIRSDDEALLAEVAVDRRLVKFRLRLLAPTVLVADASTDTLLTALRAAGYFPMPDDAAAGSSARPAAGRGAEFADADPAGIEVNVVDFSARRRQRGADAGSDRPRIEVSSRPGGVRHHDPVDAVDPAAAASRLLQPALRLTAGASATERAVRALSKRLSGPEVRQLAHAIDEQSRVAIQYESSAGKLTVRIIDRPALTGASLSAWCELRQDDRFFTVSRIRSVAAV